MTTPKGYDAVCGSCRQPYSFDNAQGCGATDWQHYCCRTCERNAAPLEGLSRDAFDAFAVSKGLSPGYNARESAWEAWQEAARRAAMKESPHG